jgi:hypothetical protein
MNINKIHKQLLSSRLLFFIVVFVIIIERLYPIGNQWNNPSFWGSLLIQVGIAFFLLQLDHIFNIIQVRTFLPALFYLLFTGNPCCFYDLKGSIAALCVVLSYYFLFDSYQKPKSQINAMNISILLTLGSLLWTPLLFLLPIFWIGFYWFQSLNARVFFASLTGFVTVYLFIFTWSILQGDKTIFLSLLPQFDTLFAIHNPDLTFLEWIVCGVILFIYSVIGLYLFFFNISERIWTISVLKYLYFSTFIYFIFYFLQSEYKSTWGLIYSIPLAILTGHFFSSSNKKIFFYLLLIFLFFFVGIGFFQHIS